VQHVDEHHGVVGVVGRIDPAAVKGSNGNVGVGANQDIDALNGQVRTFLRENERET
jgi:hypothetical protein